jgi:adenosylmethionine-8-amino-7-oxononanoate aminotransferase
VRHVANTNRYRCKYCAQKGECTLQCADEVAETIESEGPDTVAMVIMEPVQNAGGTFTPHRDYHARVREICDHYGVLQCADEVICGFGRCGEWFGSLKYDYQPDLMTTAKGITSAYQPLGAVMISDKVAEPFLTGGFWSHGITFGGHPVAAAVALRNLEIMEREDLIGNVQRNEQYFHDQLMGLMDRHAIVGDVRGVGYFKSIELVKDQATRETFDAEECQRLLRGYLSPALWEHGLICRADDRGDPVIQLSPPLICTREHLDEAIGILDTVLAGAQERMA